MLAGETTMTDYTDLHVTANSMDQKEWQYHKIYKDYMDIYNNPNLHIMLHKNMNIPDIQHSFSAPAADKV